jgi:hypothetical protein
MAVRQACAAVLNGRCIVSCSREEGGQYWRPTGSGCEMLAWLPKASRLTLMQATISALTCEPTTSIFMVLDIDRYDLDPMVVRQNMGVIR